MHIYADGWDEGESTAHPGSKLPPSPSSPVTQGEESSCQGHLTWSLPELSNRYVTTQSHGTKTDMSGYFLRSLDFKTQIPLSVEDILGSFFKHQPGWRGVHGLTILPGQILVKGFRRTFWPFLDLP